MSTTTQKAEEIDSKIQQGADKLGDKVKEGAKKVDEVLEDDEVKRATRRAEQEVNKIKSEFSEIQAKAGPQIQKAEHFLTSSTAITFYQGLVTGAALVLAYKKYIENR